MKTIITFLALLLLTACASTSTQMGPTYLGWNNNDTVREVLVTFTDLSLFAPTIKVTSLMECKTPPPTNEVDLANLDVLAKHHCRTVSGHHDVANGALNGIMQSALSSAALAYTGYAVGSGLSKSGNNIQNDYKQFNELNSHGRRNHHHNGH